MSFAGALILPLLTAAAVPAAEPAPYPSREVLEEFGKVCARLKNAAETHTDLSENGWTSYEPAKGTQLGDLIAFGREAGARILKQVGGTMTPTAVYRKRVAGEDLDIVLSGITADGNVVHGCRLYDVGETSQITLTDATSWMGRAPDRKIEGPAISILTWEPGKLVGQDSFGLYFVPQGSPAIAELKFIGLAMKADYVGARE